MFTSSVNPCFISVHLSAMNCLGFCHFCNCFVVAPKEFYLTPILFCVLLQFLYICWCFLTLQCIWPLWATVQTPVDSRPGRCWMLHLCRETWIDCTLWLLHDYQETILQLYYQQCRFAVELNIFIINNWAVIMFQANYCLQGHLMSHCSFKSLRLFKWRQAVTESFGVIVCTTVNVDKRKRKKIISEKGQSKDCTSTRLMFLCP